jgi:hypothetical protein
MRTRRYGLNRRAEYSCRRRRSGRREIHPRRHWSCTSCSSRSRSLRYGATWRRRRRSAMRRQSGRKGRRDQAAGQRRSGSR